MADEEENKEEDAATEAAEVKEPKKSAKKKYIILGGIIFVVLIIQIVTAFMFVQWIKGKDPEIQAMKKEEEARLAKIKEKTKVGATLEEAIAVTVNIAGQDGSHYLKTTIQLEWDEQEFSGLRASIDMRRPRIIDIVIRVLSIQDIAQLYKETGKRTIRETLITEINDILPQEEGKINNVFFQEFLIQ